MKIGTLTTVDGIEIKIIDYPNLLITQKFTPEELNLFKKEYERMKELSSITISQPERPKFSFGYDINWNTDKVNDTNLSFTELELNHPSVRDIEKHLRKRVDRMSTRDFRSICEAYTSGFHTFKILYEYGEFDGHRTDRWWAWTVITIAPRTNSPWCPMCGNQEGFYGNAVKAGYYYTPERDDVPSTLTPVGKQDIEIDEESLICAHCGHTYILETKFMELVSDESKYIDVCQPEGTPTTPKYGKFYQL